MRGEQHADFATLAGFLALIDQMFRVELTQPFLGKGGSGALAQQAKLGPLHEQLNKVWVKPTPLAPLVRGEPKLPPLTRGGLGRGLPGRSEIASLFIHLLPRNPVHSAED